LINTFESASSTNETVISSPSVGLDYILALNDRCGISVVSNDMAGNDIDLIRIIIDLSNELVSVELNTLLLFVVLITSPRKINDISFEYAIGNLPNKFYLLYTLYVLTLYVLTLFIILIVLVAIPITTLII
jgi:hypothetical protein